jgi:hypothetical protein
MFKIKYEDSSKHKFNDIKYKEYVSLHLWTYTMYADVTTALGTVFYVQYIKLHTAFLIIYWVISCRFMEFEQRFMISAEKLIYGLKEFELHCGSKWLRTEISRHSIEVFYIKFILNHLLIKLWRRL